MHKTSWFKKSYRCYPVFVKVLLWMSKYIFIEVKSLMVDFFHLIYTSLVITSKKSIWHHAQNEIEDKNIFIEFFHFQRLLFWHESESLRSFNPSSDWFSIQHHDWHWNNLECPNLVATSLVNLSSLLLVLTWIWVFEILQSFFSLIFNSTSWLTITYYVSHCLGKLYYVQ